MKRKSDLLIQPNLQENGVYQSVNPSSANWEFLSFEARKMKLNQSWDFETMEMKSPLFCFQEILK